jgi:hypothetical protein
VAVRMRSRHIPDEIGRATEFARQHRA